MYEGDTPNAERRAAALSLDRDLLRELLGQEELRELIDAGALEQVEADLQHRSDRTRAATRATRSPTCCAALGDLTDAEVADRVLAGVDAARDARRRSSAERRADRACASAARSAGSPPTTPACTATRSAPSPPGGLPEAFLGRRRPTRCEKLVARYARTHGPFTTGELRDRYGVDPTSALRDARARRRARARRAAPRRQRARVVRPRGPAPPAPRLAGRAAQGDRGRRPARARRASCPRWQGVDRHPAAGAGVDRLREVLVPLQGLALPADVWERDVLPRRSAPTRRRGWTSCAPRGEVVWVGAGALGRNSGRVALYFRDDAEAIGPPPNKAERPDDARARRCCASASPQAPCFFTDLLAELRARARADPGGAVGPRWAGEVTNDAWAPLRAPRLTLARAQRARDRDAAPAAASARAAPARRRRSRAAGR